MFPWARFPVLSVKPSERFHTTYNTDFKPIRKRQPWLRPRTEARSGLTMSNQPERKTSPVLFQHFYVKTNNNVSTLDSKPPSSPLFPAFSLSVGSSTPSLSGETRNAGYGDKEAALQEPGAGPGLSFCPKDEAPWQNVCGLRTNMLNQHSEEPKLKTDVHYEEGVILLSPYRGPIGREEFLQFLHKEARPSHLALPMASGPLIRPSHNTGTTSPFLQHSCSHCGWKSEHPLGCCCGTQTVPPHICRSNLKPPGQRSARTQPSRMLPLTEYQASYAAQWLQP